MVKVIIVDDEESVRTRIKRMTEKYNQDFTVLDCFSNGFDALESGLSLEPDILITDIRMPYVTGIELIRQAKIENPLIKSIIISGYDSFDYAKEAISLGAIGYLTKPVEEEELKEALYKAKREIDEQVSLKQVKDLAEKQLSSQRKLIQNEDFQRLVTLKEVPESFLIKLKEDGISLSSPYQMIFVIDNDSEEDGYQNQELLFPIIEKLMEEMFSPDNYYPFYVDGKLSVLLSGKEKNMASEEFFNQLNGFLFKVRKATSVSISIGVSEVMEYDSINYRKMYRHARRALEYRTVLGKGMILYYPDLEISNENAPIGKVDENEYKKITYLLSYGKMDELENALRSLIDTITTPIYKDSYYYILSNILDSILKASLSLGELYKTYESQIELTRICYSLKSKEATLDFFLTLSNKVVEINKNRKINNILSSYDRIKKFIDCNYSNCDLSIEDVADDLCFSVSYITAIFKKNGTTFTRMLTDKRMEEAKIRLKNNEDKVIFIAKEVGYSDPYYFSHCFKKVTGESPDEYRKKAKA